MADLTVANFLGALQEDPYDEEAYASLKNALASGDPVRLGEDHVRHMEFARRNHEVRGEAYAAARLIEIELSQAGGEDPDFASAMWKELGRLRRDELLDDQGAREAYERALSLRPGDEEVQDILEQIGQTRDRWKELASHFKTQAREASDAQLKTSLLVRAAIIVWQYQQRGKNKDVDRLFKEALRTDEANARAVRLYEITLRARSKWREAGKVLMSAMTRVPGRDDRLGLSLAAARVHARQLEAPDEAAECYQAALDYAPGNDEALSYLAAYFQEREQWDHLVALYEDALRSRQLRAGAEMGMLLQIGMVHWRRRGAPDKAEPYFAKLRKLAPAQPVMLDFYRERLQDGDGQGKLVGILADAQRAAVTDDEKLKVALDLARLASHQEGATERAIDAYKTVLRIHPGHEEASAALKELYRRAGKWNALVEVLRAEFDSVDSENKPRRLALLRELLPIYRDELSLDVMVLNTYNAILEQDPTDAEAITQLAKTYEGMGRWNDLIPLLQRQAEAAPDPAEKVALLTRVAQLWIEHFSNYNQATAPLERVLEIDPAHPEALAQLRQIYTKKRAWKPLLAVMQRQAELVEAPADKRPLLVELAKLAAERLQAYEQAIGWWKQALAIDDADPAAIDALEKLAERAKDWDTLAEVLERRVAEAPDDAAKIKLLTRLGTMLGERAGAPDRAARAWQRILEIDPKQGRALRTLRESFLAAGDWDGLQTLYADAGDWEGLADVLGNAADRSDDAQKRVDLSFRAAAIYEDQLSAPQRAFRAYERVLQADPQNERAARALLPLYRQSDKWPKVVGLLDILLARLPEGAGDERQQVLEEATEVCLERLRDGDRSYQYAEAAYDLAPQDEQVHARLLRAVDLSGNFEGLMALYTKHAAKAEGERAVDLRRRAAQVAAERLARPGDAAVQLVQLLEERPDDHEASRILEGIYRAEGRVEDLRSLLVARVQRADDPILKRETLAELAMLEEELLDDASAAAGRYRAMLELDPSDGQALAALDRFAVEEGRHTEVAEVLRRRIEVAADGAERVALTLRLGELCMEHLGDVSGAIGAFSDVLAAEKGQPSAVHALESLARQHPEHAVAIGRLLEDVYVEAGDLSKLGGVLETRLSRAEDEEEKRSLRLQIAEVASTLGDPRAAYETLEAALLDHPTERDLWDRIARVAEQADAHDRLAEAYATVLDAPGQDPDGVAELSQRVARLYDEVLGQAAKAEPFYARVLAHDSGADRAFEALKEFYTNEERWDSLKALYRDRIAYTADANAKLDLLLQVCFLYEELLDDVDGAIQAYQQVLELEPGHASSRRALERLYTRAECWPELSDLLEGDLADAEGKDAIDLMFRLGELSELKLGQSGEAVDRYAGVLDAQPTHLRAQEALERMLSVAGERQRIAQLLEPLYENQGAYPELVRVLEVQLEAIDEPGARVGLLLRVAEIIGTQLRDPEAAFSALLRALEADPADTIVREQLDAVARQAGRERERAEALERALSSTDDSVVRVDILRELAEIWDARLDDSAQAEHAYARLISEDADNPDVVLSASRALEQLHLAAEDFPALAKDLRRQVAFEEDTEVRRGLLVRLAELTELSLSDPEGAVAIHRERLELDPGDVDAMVALCRLYEQRGQWAPLIEVLSLRDQAAADEDEARELVRRTGEIYERELDDADHAVAAYNDVISRFGADRETLSRLCALHERREQWQALLDAVLLELEIVDDERERAQVRFRAAELMRTRTFAAEEAVEAYRQILIEVPEHEGAARALHEVATTGGEARVQAAQTLVPHYEAVGDHEGLVRMLEVVADTDDVPEALAALRRASHVAEQSLNDPGRSFGIVSRAVRLSLAEPDLGEFLDQLHALAEVSERWSVYGSLLREVAPDVLDEDLQLTCLMRAALVARDHDEDVALSREYFGRVLEVRPEHREALDALSALHERVGDHRGLLEVLRRKVDVVDEPSERVDLLIKQAKLSAGPLDDVDSAIAAYEQVLEELPSSDVFAGLEELYRRSGRHHELAAMYERQLDADIGDVVRVRYSLGELHRTELGDPERALEHFRDVLETGPTHGPTCEALEKLLEHESLRGQVAELLEPVFLRRQDWPKLIVALEAQLEHLIGAEDRKPLLRRLAELHEVQLEDLEGSFEVHARMFRDDPGDAEVLDTLERLARVLDRPQRLAQVYEQEIEDSGVGDEAHVALAVRCAEIRAQAGEPQSATRLYGLALSFDAQRIDIAYALEQVLIQRGAIDELAELYRAQADVAEGDERRVLMLHKLAVLTEKDRADADGAVGLLQEVLSVSPADSKAIESLDRLLTQGARWADLSDHLRHRIDVCEDAAEALPLKIRLGGVLYEHLEDVEGAIDCLEEITQERPNYPPALQTLEGLMDQPQLRPRVSEILNGLYEASGEWQKLVRVYERCLEIEQDPVERIRILSDIAQQYEHAGKKPTQAFRAWGRAFILDPTDERPRAEVERLAEQLGAWDGLVQAYERALGAAADDFARANLLSAMARVHDDRRGDPRAAIATYERLLSLESDDPAPLDHLESLHTMVGDWRGLVDVTQRKLERAFDPEERAELARRAGSVLEDLLGDVDGAIDAYRRALSELDDDTNSLEALDRLYTQTEAWESLAPVLQHRLELAAEPETRVDVAMRLGEVLAGPLVRRVEAIDAYVRVLEDAPEHAEAAAALGELYEHEEMWSELLDNLRQRAELADTPDARMALVFRAGQVLEHQLSDPFEAIESYRAVLEQDPRHEGAIEALMGIGQHPDYRAQVDEILEPLLREHGRWDDLAELMSRSSTAVVDPFEKQQMLVRLAQVHEEGRQDLGAAFDTYCEALVQDADEPALADEVERLASSISAFDRAADALTQRAKATGDDLFAKQLYQRLAALAEQRLRDVPRAIEALVQASERSGDDPECLAELDRLYVAAEAWPELSSVLERRVDHAESDAEAADVLVRLAELRESHFEDAEGALAAYRDALERVPMEPRAVAALERMLDHDALARDAVDLLEGVYRQAGDLTRVAELYDTRVRLADTTGEKVGLLQELAGMWERDLGQPTRALEALRTAFELDPLDPATLDEIERVASEGAGFEPVRGLIEAVRDRADLDRTERRDLSLRAAGWYADRLGDTALAEQSLRAAIAEDAECTEAHERLTGLLRDAGREADLIQALADWAEHEPDMEAAKEKLFEAASLAEQSGDVDAAVERYKRVYALDEGATGALDQLIRIRETQSSWSHVAELLDHRIDAELDADTRVALRHRAATVRLSLHQEPSEAERLFTANLEDDPTDLSSMDALGAIYEKAERWPELRALLERRLDVVDSVAERVTVRVRLASLAERQFGQRDDAIEQLNEVLMDVPHHAEALEELERLLYAAERWDEVGDLIERRIDLAIDAGDTDRELSLRVRQGELFEQHQENTDRAVDVFEQVLEREPGHVGALRALVRLHAAAGEVARGAETLEQLIERANGDELVDTAWQLAELVESQLDEPERAEQALRKALTAGVRTSETRAKLAELLERRKDHAGLAEVLEAQVDALEDPAAKVELLRRIARLYVDELAEPGRAGACLERASQLMPGDRDVLLPLCDLYIEAGRQEDAVPVLEKIIASYNGRRAKEVATFHHRLGRAYLGMGDNDRALKEFDNAFRIDLTNVPILVDLGVLCHQKGDLERAQKTFRALLLQKLDHNSPVSKADVYYYLGDIASQRGDKLKAVSMLERALAEQRDHNRAGELLGALKG